MQGFKRIGCDGAIGGERVVNVREHACDFVAGGLGPRREGSHLKSEAFSMVCLARGSQRQARMLP